MFFCFQRTHFPMLVMFFSVFREPISHVSNALVQIDILDIDNKPPRFSRQMHYDDTDKNNNDSFEGLDIHYH
jgi:hypothetical protein